MAKLLGVLAHPNRIRIMEELRDGDHDVSSLQAALGISRGRSVFRHAGARAINTCETRRLSPARARWRTVATGGARLRSALRYAVLPLALGALESLLDGRKPAA